MIRRATIKDYPKIYQIIIEKNIPYITTTQIFSDITNKECYLIEDCGKIKAICSFVACPSYHNYAIKRLCVIEERHGYGKQIIGFLINQKVNLPIVCTPWEDNIAMRSILEYYHFQLKSIFNNKWCLYERRY
jgi:hypothetical protein